MAVGALLRREGLDSRCLQQAHSAIGAAVQPHLEQFGQVVGITEESRVALHAAREGGQLVVDVAVDVLAAQVGILFGIGNLVARELAQRAVHRVIGTQRSKDVVVDIVVERRVRHALHGISQQREVTAAVQVFLLAQLGVVHAVHDRVIGHTTAPQAIGNGDVELVGLDLREDVGAHLGVLVTPGTVHDLDGVGSVFGPGDEGTAIGIGIHHHLPHVERGRHARLVVEQVTEGDVLLVAAAQAGDVLARLVVEAELAVVKGLHHAADGAGGLGDRS